MSDEQQTSERIIGTLQAADGTGSVRMEDLYATDVDDLWGAITEPDRLARWIAEVSGDLRLGGEIHARFTSSWEGPGRIDACEAPHRLLLTMGPSDDRTEIEVWLTAEGDSTRLVVEERGLPVEEIAAHGAGWQAHVEDLAALVDGRPRTDWHTRWTELSPSYRHLAGDL